MIYGLLFFVKDEAFCGMQLTVMQDVLLHHHGDSECHIGSVEEKLSLVQLFMLWVPYSNSFMLEI